MDCPLRIIFGGGSTRLPPAARYRRAAAPHAETLEGRAGGRAPSGWAPAAPRPNRRRPCRPQSARSTAARSCHSRAPCRCAIATAASSSPLAPARSPWPRRIAARRRCSSAANQELAGRLGALQRCPQLQRRLARAPLASFGFGQQCLEIGQHQARAGRLPVANALLDHGAARSWPAGLDLRQPRRTLAPAAQIGNRSSSAISASSACMADTFARSPSCWCSVAP